MNTFYNQSKGDKVTATQEMFTAQNSSNQSNDENLILGCFTKDDLYNIGSLVYGDSNGFIKPNFYVDYFTRLNRLIDGARIPSDVKGLIKGGYGLLAAAIVERFDYSIKYSKTPEEIEEMVCLDEDGFRKEGWEEGVHYARIEMEKICGCVSSMVKNNQDGRYDSRLKAHLYEYNRYRTSIGAVLEPYYPENYAELKQIGCQNDDLKRIFRLNQLIEKIKVSAEGHYEI